jgi:hypothetical protein
VQVMCLHSSTASLDSSWLVSVNHLPSFLMYWEHSDSTV